MTRAFELLDSNIRAAQLELLDWSLELLDWSIRLTRLEHLRGQVSSKLTEILARENDVDARLEQVRSVAIADSSDANVHLRPRLADHQLVREVVALGTADEVGVVADSKSSSNEVLLHDVGVVGRRFRGARGSKRVGIQSWTEERRNSDRNSELNIEVGTESEVQNVLGIRSQFRA